MPIADPIWARVALIWLYAASPNASFIHIPKTGGSAVDGLDPFNVRAAFLHDLLARWTVSYTSAAAIRSGEGSVSCSGPSLQALTHATPNHFRLCGFGAGPHPRDIFAPQQAAGGLVYCTIREPISRFMSEFIFAHEEPQHWPGYPTPFQP